MPIDRIYRDLADIYLFGDGTAIEMNIWLKILRSAAK